MHICLPINLLEADNLGSSDILEKTFDKADRDQNNPEKNVRWDWGGDRQ